MTETMRAVVVDGRSGIALVDKPIPEPGPEQVLIQVEATGVCGTDLHLIEGSYPHGRYPVTPGHEFSGIVVAVGSGATRAGDGDHVGVDPNVNCGACRWCREGAKNMCTALDPVGVSIDGSCAEFVVVPESVIYRLPGGIDATVGPLVEPLSCVLHAVERTPGAWEGASVAVYGAGSIGLLAVAVARLLGAGTITVVEPHEVRRQLALTIGADAASDGSGPIREVDIAVEASGHPAAIANASRDLGIHGRLVQMGVANPDVEVGLNPYAVFAKELSIIGSNSLAGAYPAAVEMMPALADRVRPIVTDIFSLEDYAQAVEAARSPHSVKVQVRPAAH